MAIVSTATELAWREKETTTVLLAL